ncbi:MAG: hypothetical protein C0515_09790 [Novosphingobium sp.]|nr:hypothetical protein [Novosphingobium sp.]
MNFIVWFASLYLEGQIMKKSQAVVRRVFVSTALLFVILAGGIARAQTAPTEGQAAPPANPVATPAPAPSVAPAALPVQQPASAAIAAPSADGLDPPKLDFTPDAKTAEDYDKYFYFHRTNTTFAEAYADIRECHGLAGGKVAYRQGNSAFADTYTTSYLIPQYGMAGALGGALGGALVGLLIGGGNHDKIHRINIRNCMGFKGYQRYGLPKDLWEEFNLSPGKSRKNAEGSERALRLQALVASGAQPKQEAIAQ